MDYAIIEINGKQFWVEIGKFYDLSRIPTQIGKDIILNRILLVKNNEKIFIGQPYLKNVKIHGKIIKHLRSKKKIIYKMRSKKKTRCKQSYRQELTRVLIKKITIIN